MNNTFSLQLLGSNKVVIKDKTYYKNDFYTGNAYKPIVSYYTSTDYSSLANKVVKATFEADVINNKLKLINVEGE